MKVVIIGGVAGGASCAARLRRLSEDAEIVLFERGENISYANCGLPYYLGGIIREESALASTYASGRKWLPSTAMLTPSPCAPPKGNTGRVTINSS